MSEVIINTNYDIEQVLFNKFKDFMVKNSKFNPQVFPKAPKTLADFPTIVFKESSNIEDTRYKSLDRTQFVNQITDTIEIYTKDMVINGVRYASKTVMSELKYLVFDFFESIGATRVSCEPVEYSNYQVDRVVIIERYRQNNWNKMI
jgi:hypothetical protein